MERTHFGLRSRPFRSSPDTQFYYAATTHEAASSELRQAVEREDSFLLLTGGSGTGKTMLLHRLAESLPEGVTSLFLSNPRCGSRAELLQAMLFEMRLPYQGGTEQELRLTLTEAFLQTFAAGHRSLVLVDEAHYLSADQLEELRLLTNLEGKEGRAVQVLLSGQPELLKTVELPALHSLRQRLGCRCHLERLSLEESLDYLAHRVRIAGGRAERLFDGEGRQILAEVADGVPRLLNQLAARALEIAEAAGADRVDAETALEAASRLGLEIPEESAETLEMPPLRPVPLEVVEVGEADEEEGPPAILARVPDVAQVAVPIREERPDVVPMTPLPAPPTASAPAEAMPTLTRPTPMVPTLAHPRTEDHPRVLVYTGQPTGTPLEKIEELLRSRRQGS